MATKNSIDNIYSSLVGGLNLQLQSDDFYQYFIKSVKAGRNSVGLTHSVVERTVSGEWLNKIEETIIPLDNIIRNPRRYIKNIEDVVPIEMARGITTESVKHLAQHTNMIAQVAPDGTVTPDRILNVLKEESYDTYENRFIFTLLQNLDYFIMRRLNVINEGGKDITEFVLNGECMIGREKIAYRLNFMCEGRSYIQQQSNENLLNVDVSKLTIVQRIERIRRILYNFQESFLIKELKDCIIVRPPLHITNVLAKNPDFVKAVELWNFISNYKEDGIEASTVETTIVPNDKFISEIYSLLPLEYALLKQTVEGVVEVAPEMMTQSKERSEPTVAKERLESLVDSLDLDVDEIRKVFNDSLSKKTKKRAAERSRIDGIIKRVFQIEKPWLEKEKVRLKNKEAKILLAEKAERERLKKEAIRLEQERIEAEKREQERLEQERIEAEKREKERIEQERIEAEKREKERIEQERIEAERLAKEAEEAEKLALEQEQNIEEKQEIENSIEELAEQDVTADVASEEEFEESPAVADDAVTSDLVQSEAEDVEKDAIEEQEELLIPEEKSESRIKNLFNSVTGWFKGLFKIKAREDSAVEDSDVEDSAELVEELLDEDDELTVDTQEAEGEATSQEIESIENQPEDGVDENDGEAGA